MFLTVFFYIYKYQSSISRVSHKSLA